jgi:hypothetical protein
MSIQTILVWLENTPLAQAIAESPVLFPTIESIHVLAITFVVGSIALVDLRLLGLTGRDQKPGRIAADILPWTWGAFILAACAGSLLFASQAEKYFGNTAFRTKFSLMALAGINMLVFQLITGRNIDSWPEDAPTPLTAKIAGGLSLALWVGVVTCGRLIGFTMFG